ncbi:PepSY-associated TM helix domain-containing protein [Hyphomicrobium sp.]|uniref:PepSY-associated TM helix domain-containing protein n=1 Tax=Hyphomicrobium sp. TaxID=82 RepID=UPI003F6F3004
MRATFTVVHRWAGLFIAVFLFIAGATGAVISWDHELDEWLNAHLFDAKATGKTLSPHELVSRAEAADPRIRVSYFPLSFEDGHNASLFVEPRVDPKTGELYNVEYNQVFIDPVSGDVAGKRFWGAVSLDRENILPFLYKLHYSMHIPDFWGIDRWGMWFMGIVGIVWLFDCFVGFYLTLPRRAGQVSSEIEEQQSPVTNGARRSWWQRWKPAWTIKRGAGSYRRNLDLHRAFGLWLWAALLILAFTSISMNLNNEVVRPILSRLSSLTPDAFDDRTPVPSNKPIEPKLTFPQAIDIASEEARRRGWTEPAGAAFYGLEHGIYSISFFEPGDDHGSGGMGVKMLFFDGATGAPEGGRIPWEGTAADIFMQLQFPLHSGRIAGLPGRVFLSVMGVVVALLSATGMIIWFKKRAGRISKRRAARTHSGIALAGDSN